MNSILVAVERDELRSTEKCTEPNHCCPLSLSKQTNWQQVVQTIVGRIRVLLLLTLDRMCLILGTKSLVGLCLDDLDLVCSDISNMCNSFWRGGHQSNMGTIK